MVAVKNVTTASERAKKKKTIDTDKEASLNASGRTETWARAVFHWNEIPGGTWSAKPNLKKEIFTDGQEYDRPLSLFKMLNENCRVVNRKLVKPNDGSIGVYVKTNTYNPRLYFEILERYEKEV